MKYSLVQLIARVSKKEKLLPIPLISYAQFLFALNKSNFHLQTGTCELIQLYNNGNNIHLMYGPEGNSWSCFPESLNVSQDEVEGNIRTRGKTKLTCFPRDHTLIKHFFIYLDFPLNNHMVKTCCCTRRTF